MTSSIARTLSPVSIHLPLAAVLAVNAWLQPGATVLAALVAITAAIITVVVQRRTSMETIGQARRAADSAALSAAAADRSSKAAEVAVGVNRETAAGVGRRAEADALAKRYQDAAQQIGHEKAAVRLAGVYTMARLADDWPEQRQSCVDVLCAYLRMPNHPETAQAAAGEREVRTAILRLIGDHLAAELDNNWCDCGFDFSYAELPAFNWSAPSFRKQPDFSHTRIENMAMRRATFERGANFIYAAFEGLVQIQRARIPSGDVILYGADISRGIFTTDSLAEGSTINLSKSVCRGEFAVVCSPDSEQPQGRIALHEVVVKAGGKLSLRGVDLESTGDSASNCVMSDPNAVLRVEPNGSVTLPGTFKEFSGADIYNDVWKNS
jgi:hypothetical protein